MNTNAAPALFAGQKIDGGAVHVFKSFSRGVATYCTGRSISMVVGSDAPVTCKACAKKAAANGLDVNNLGA
jgi:hypothetical protein